MKKERAPHAIACGAVEGAASAGLLVDRDVAALRVVADAVEVQDHGADERQRAWALVDESLAHLCDGLAADSVVGGDVPPSCLAFVAVTLAQEAGAAVAAVTAVAAVLSDDQRLARGRAAHLQLHARHEHGDEVHEKLHERLPSWLHGATHIIL